jgi:hypothetical protein
LSAKVFELDKSLVRLPDSMVARQRLVTASLEYLEGLSRERLPGDPVVNNLAKIN